MRRLSITKRMLLLALAPMIAIVAAMGLIANGKYETLKEQKLIELRQQVDTAISIYAHTIASEAGEEAAFANVGALRYGDGEYFFSLRGTTMLMHPIKESLIGKDLAGVADPAGFMLFAEFDRQIKENGEAVVAYMWPRAGSEDPVAKLSFARLIPGTDIYVGTGVYVDDLSAAFYASLQSMLLMVGGIFAVLAVLVAVVVRSVTGPLAVLSNRMLALSEGDVASPVRDLDGVDDIGAMARALDQFRKQAENVERLAKEQEAADAVAVEQRRALMSSLSDAFGRIIDAAATGDFSGRITERFPDEELTALADGLNGVLDRVETGVSETGRVMEMVAAGDLSQRMSGDFEGVFAELQSNVNATVERLEQLMSQIGDTAASVRQNVGSITSGSENLSERAEQQASALQETSATMEEMSGSIKSNADAAAEASTQAEQASAKANRGGEIVSSTVDAMRGIESSSAKVSDIVGVIDSIAFQTNLLALNAAVEAARAGDAGKGFAVVASEVRTLAQRASDASKDIRELVEASSAQVADGVKLVTETGDALQGIVDSIGQVTQSVRSIARASTEQASGVSEISAAISNMDQMTQQNAALAQQSVSNSRGLLESAGQLEQVIQAFGASSDAREEDVYAA